MALSEIGALVCTVRANQPLRFYQHLGRAVQQFCLSLIHSANPFLSAQIHDHPHAAKPYSVSGLLVMDDTRPLTDLVRPGDRGWLRLVGLSRGVMAALEDFAAQPPKTVMLDYVPWDLEHATWEAHPWAGQTSLSDLLRFSQQTAPPRRFVLDFAAPTAFHKDGLNVPLPMPILVFGSLLHQWDDLYPEIPLPDDLWSFIEYRLALSRHETRTAVLTMKHNSKQIGFLGEAQYTVVRNSKLEKQDPALAARLDAQSDDLLRALGLLVDFGFYSGVGIKTTTGMGLMRANKSKALAE